MYLKIGLMLCPNEVPCEKPRKEVLMV